MRPKTGEGIGQSVPRLEDDRYLRGKGEFIADIRLAGMRDMAFARSPFAHARIRGIRKPPGFEASVFTAADLTTVRPIVAVSGLPGFRSSAQPVLADTKVRHVGEPIAACVAASRAEAEDLAASVEVDFEELPAIIDMRESLKSGIRLHDHWDDNVFLETFVHVEPERFDTPAPIVVRKRLRTARQCMSPLEGRGVVATWDRRLEQLLVYTSTQMPHVVRTGLAGCLGLPEARIRVVAPDVGGGFGYKGILLAEEVCVAWLSRKLGHPVRWIEDRREQLTGNANCREHDYDITVHAEADGRLIGIARLLAMAAAGGWLDPGSPVEAGIANPAAACKDPEDRYLRVFRGLWMDEELHRLRIHPVVTDLFNRIFGEPALAHPMFVQRNIFPRTGSFDFTTGMHQDRVHIGGATSYALWMPLGDCPREKGALAVAAGSHRQGVLDTKVGSGANAFCNLMVTASGSGFCAKSGTL